MKHEVTRRGRHALLVLLIGCLLGLFVSAGPVMAQDANPLRALPAAVAPGDTFEVTVTFTSPVDVFHAIGLNDLAPAGWNVRVDTAWCTPLANAANPAIPWSTDLAEYIWFGPFNAGVDFTAVYEVQVPADAAFDTYTFPGGALEYYISGVGPNVQAIGGAFQIEVALYDLTIDSTEGGTVTVPGEGLFPDYEPGEVVALAAVADECYEFAGWTGDTGTIDDPESATTTITMDGNYSITANFALIQYDLTVTSTAGGSVTTPGENTFTYDCGDIVDLVAVAHEGYEFAGWTGDTDTIADPDSATTTITVDGDYSITASFALIQYDLTIDSTEGGSVTTPGEGTFEGYDPGEVVDLVAVADECYEFAGWTGDTGTIDDPESATTTITMDGDYSITANFVLLQFDLTIDSTEGGSVTTPGENTFTYDCGDIVDLVAAAHEGYEFAGWTGDTDTIADPDSATTTIIVDGDYSITANFALIHYDLTIDSTEGGTVTVPGEGLFPDYEPGEVVALAAVADECYEFAGWTGDTDTIADPESATTTITMDGDYSITANFVLLQFDLTIDSTEGGSVTTPGENTFAYDCGDIVDLVAVADVGYLFSQWTGDTDGIADQHSATTTITMNDDYSITAEFVAFDAVIEGQVRGANCDVLSGVTVSLYSDDTLVAATVTDVDGNYELAAPDLGHYSVVASKEGFRDRQETIEVTEPTTYTIDFIADHGLIPNAPDISYVLKCINLWQYGAPPCELTMTKVLAVINAWQFPIHII